MQRIKGECLELVNGLEISREKGSVAASHKHHEVSEVVASALDPLSTQRV